MKKSSLRVFRSLALVAYVCSGLLGCAGTRNVACNKDVSHRFCSVEVLSPNPLGPIDFEARKPIEVLDGTKILDGFPLEPLKPAQVRELTFTECEVLAKGSSPISRQLDSHRNWLKRNSAPPTSVLNAMAYQAQHETRVHTALALESYLNLVEVYVQQSNINQAQATIVEAESAMAKFRAAGVETLGDSSELERQGFVLKEKSSTLWLAHGRLNDGLEVALDLEHNIAIPIWPAYVANQQELLLGESEMIEKALNHRGDLLAIKQLACDLDSLSSNELRSVVSSANPLLGITIPLPVSLKWWQCVLREKSEHLKRLANCELQRQLYGLIEAKEKLIRQEVSEVYYSLRHHREMLQLKELRLQSLTDSLNAESKAKDERPVQFATRVGSEMKKIELLSEVIHEKIAIEVEFVRLEKVLGVDLEVL